MDCRLDSSAARSRERRTLDELSQAGRPLADRFDDESSLGY